MADEYSADAPDASGPEGDNTMPQVVLPSREALPPPPQVNYTRPTLAGPQKPAVGSRRSDSPPGRSQATGSASGYTSLGAGMAAATTFVASVVAGVLIGQWIDHRWGHPGGTPWATLVFSLLGIAAGFLNLFRVLSATDRTEKK